MDYSIQRESQHFCITFILAVNVVFTQMDYYGNAADGYAQDICVEIYPDPVGFVNGWEGFFISSGKTTISTAVDILTQSRDFVDSFEVNLNATELEYCFNIYSSIVNLLDGESDAYFSLHQPDSLDSYLYISYNGKCDISTNTVC